MLSGLLMELDDHNCWTIAEAVGHRGPHRLQHFLSRALWDDQHLADIAAAWAASHLDDGDATTPPAATPPGTACCWPGGTATPASCRSTGAGRLSRCRCPG